MIELKWECVEVSLEGQREIAGLDRLRLNSGRLVYVVETPVSHPIRYAKGTSNVCYIGRQSDRQTGSRPYAHARGWISRFLFLAQPAGAFKIHVCYPRRRNLPDAYRDIEAFLLDEFEHDFGSPPVFNRRKERQFGEYDVRTNASFLENRGFRDKDIAIPAIPDPEIKDD